MWFIALDRTPRLRYNNICIALTRFCERKYVMDEKKRERMMKVFRVVALLLAIAMIIGVFVQSFSM